MTILSTISKNFDPFFSEITYFDSSITCHMFQIPGGPPLGVLVTPSIDKGLIVYPIRNF